MDSSMLSVIFSGLTALASLTVTVIIARMNNKNILRAKKYEVLTVDKEEAFKNYVLSLNKFIHTTISEKFRGDKDKLFMWHQEYVKNFSNIMLFANNESKEKMLGFDNYLQEFMFFINAKNYAGLGKTLDDIVEEFGKDMGEFDSRVKDITDILSEDLNTIEEIKYQEKTSRKKR